jgi:HMG box factor
MPATVEVASSNLHTPQSPVSVSTESGRRESLRAVHPEKDLELPTPISPQGRSIRKRAATLITDASSHRSSIGDLSLNSASSSSPPTSDLAREQVCLCQRDPKIPRPRNGS